MKHFIAHCTNLQERIFYFQVAEMQNLNYSFYKGGNMKMSQYIILTILLLGSSCVLAAGFGKINKFFSGKKEWLKKLNALPVLKTEDEILEALKGAPKDYLVENQKQQIAFSLFVVLLF